MSRRMRRLRARTAKGLSGASGRVLAWVALVVGLLVLAWQLLTLAALTVASTAHAASGTCPETGPCDAWSTVAVDALLVLLLLLSGILGTAVGWGRIRNQPWARRRGVLSAAAALVWAGFGGVLLFLALTR